jgi:hypothetical protein
MCNYRVVLLNFIDICSVPENCLKNVITVFPPLMIFLVHHFFLSLAENKIIIRGGTFSPLLTLVMMLIGNNTIDEISEVYPCTSACTVFP